LENLHLFLFHTHTHIISFLMMICTVPRTTCNLSVTEERYPPISLPSTNGTFLLLHKMDH